MRGFRLVCPPVLVLLLVGAASGQNVTVGSLPASPNFALDPSLGTAVDLAFPANGAGQLDSATFVWSMVPCPTAVKLKFFRLSGGTLIFLGERGPFDVNVSTQSVVLSPAVPVLAGDLIGVATLTNCGGLSAQSPGAPEGYVVFPADVVSNVDLVDGTQTSGATLAVQATGPSTDAVSGVLPVVGSTPGVPPSFFRTSVQLYNPGPSPISGRLVYHPQGVAGGSGDPSLAYSLQSGETRTIPDLLPEMDQAGLGSLDVVASGGADPPILIARVFNDAGSEGTTGFTEEVVPPFEALVEGDRGFLIVPPDLEVFRFNIGVRTLSIGATLTATLRTSTGTVLNTVSKSYPVNYFLQQSAAQFLGLGAGETLGPNSTISIDVTSGSAILYGATVDNRTQDPSIQFARPAP
jgi:hypothetical protein